MMRAANMQALTDDIKAGHPGVVIGGKGDPAHAARTSDHNEDDTPGSKPEQTDADSVPEHRAIDVMLGPAFSKADADELVNSLLADPAALARLKYIIWNGYIWSRSNGWKRTKYTGKDQHTGHVHISGLAADDENTAGWPAVRRGVVLLFCYYGADNDPATKALQVRLKNLGFYTGAVDGDYGNGTKAALLAACKAVNPSTGADGSAYNHDTMFYVDVLMARKYGSGPGPAGPKGDPGPPGEPGPKGDSAVLGAGMLLLVQES